MLLYMKLDYHTACAIVVIIGFALYFIVRSPIDSPYNVHLANNGL